jgi:hypothetical protein
MSDVCVHKDENNWLQSGKTDSRIEAGRKVPSLTWCLQLGGDCQPDNIKSLRNVQSAQISRKRFTDMNYLSPQHRESEK